MLSTSNCNVKILTEITIRYPMSCSWNNYRELLNRHGTIHLQLCFLNWKLQRLISKIVVIRLFT